MTDLRQILGFRLDKVVWEFWVKAEKSESPALRGALGGAGRRIYTEKAFSCNKAVFSNVCGGSNGLCAKRLPRCKVERA